MQQKRTNNFKSGQIWVRTFGERVYYKVVSCQQGKLAYSKQLDSTSTCDKFCKCRLVLRVLGNSKGYCCSENLNNFAIKKLTKLEVLLEHY